MALCDTGVRRDAGGSAWLWALLLGTSGLALSVPPTGAAPEVAGAPKVESIEASRRAFRTAKQDFAIPAGDLADALQTWSAAAGLKLFVSTDLVTGYQTEGLSGSLTPEAALRALLVGTPLKFQVAGPRTVALFDGTALRARAQASIELPPIVVRNKRAAKRPPAPKQVAPPVTPPPAPPPTVVGYVASKSAAGTKTNTPVIETPQSISVVTSQQIRDQGAQSVGEALRYTAGVTTEPNGDTSRYDETRIRGFEPIQYLDGLRLPTYQFFAAPRIEPYGLERIDVVKGPASALYGQSSPGGLLDMISKRPTAEPFREVVFQAGTYNRLQAAFDVGGPLTADKTVLYRLTGLLRDGETVVDFSKDDRYFIAPALAFKPNNDTSFAILTQFQRDNGTFPQNFLPAQGTLLPNPNGVIPPSRFTGEPGVDYFKRNTVLAGYQFEHRFDDVWTVRQNFRYSSTKVDFLSFYSFGFADASLREIDRGLSWQRINASAVTLDNQAQADFRTGAFRHKVLMGVDYQRTKGDYKHLFGYDGSNLLDLFTPNYGQSLPELSTWRNDAEQTQSQVGVYLQDQIKFNQWVLTLGGRHDSVSTDTTDHLKPLVTQKDENAFTGRVGLTYLFENGVAPYVSFATSFQPTLGVDRLNMPFKATTARQQEVGVKYQPPGTDALFTLAAFDITQKNALSPDPADINNFIQTGEIRVRGFEAEAKVALSRNVDIIGAYTYLDTRITESSEPSEIGKRVPLTYEHQAALWGLYTFRGGALDGLGLGAGVRYRGGSYGTNANDLLAPAHMLVDATVKYDMEALNPAFKGLRLALNATNLFDKRHVVYCGGLPYCSYGAGRTLLATASYRW
jgi:iron complex outermembrane receptor protein